MTKHFVAGACLLAATGFSSQTSAKPAPFAHEIRPLSIGMATTATQAYFDSTSAFTVTSTGIRNRRVVSSEGGPVAEENEPVGNTTKPHDTPPVYLPNGPSTKSSTATGSDDASDTIGADTSDDVDRELSTSTVWDPIEPVNRSMLDVNDFLDINILAPVSRAYGWLMPDVMENGIRNIFENLGEPATFFNQLLQGRFKEAGDSFARFTLNTTVGLVGFVDFADQIGLEREIADFGQTLYSWGIKSGPYLVLPIMGPTTTRDGVGNIVDTAADPLIWIGVTDVYSAGAAGLDGISLRHEVGPSLEELRRSSIDWYATLRSAYIQDRRSFLRGDTGASTEEIDALFDELDEFE